MNRVDGPVEKSGTSFRIAADVGLGAKGFL
jgi:hypothetical protein